MQPRSRGRADTGTPAPPWRAQGPPTARRGSPSAAANPTGRLHVAASARTGEADPMVEAYKRDVDRTLLRQNLRRSVTERVENLIALQELAAEARRAGRAPGGVTGDRLQDGHPTVRRRRHRVRDRRRPRGHDSRVGAPHPGRGPSSMREPARNIDRVVDALRPHAPYPRGCSARPALRLEPGDDRARPQLHADHHHRRHRPPRRDHRAAETTRRFCPTARRSRSSAADAGAWICRN